MGLLLLNYYLIGLFGLTNCCNALMGWFLYYLLRTPLQQLLLLYVCLFLTSRYKLRVMMKYAYYTVHVYYVGKYIVTCVKKNGISTYFGAYSDSDKSTQIDQ